MIQYYLRSLTYLFFRWILHKEFITARASFQGLKFKVKPEDAIGRAIYKRKVYEESLTVFLLENLSLSKDDIFLDIGANIGWYTAVLNTHYGVTTYAFEPDPLNFSLLEHNIKKNKLVHVTAMSQAVADVVGVKTLYLYPSKNRGRHSLLPINYGKEVSVQTTTLDAFISAHKIKKEQIKFIKIDIEGYEYFALKGAEDLLPHIPYILSEFSSDFMERGGVKPVQQLDLLSKHHFNPHVVSSEGLVSVSRQEILSKKKNMNLLWIKEGYVL